MLAGFAPAAAGQFVAWGAGTIRPAVVSAALVALGFARQGGSPRRSGSWLVTGSLWWAIRIVGIVTVATWVITTATLVRFRREGWRPSRRSGGTSAACCSRPA